MEVVVKQFKSWQRTHLLSNCRELEHLECLIKQGWTFVDIDYHHCLASTTEKTLEQTSQLTIPVWDHSGRNVPIMGKKKKKKVNTKRLIEANPLFYKVFLFRFQKGNFFFPCPLVFHNKNVWLIHSSISSSSVEKSRRS